MKNKLKLIYALINLEEGQTLVLATTDGPIEIALFQRSSEDSSVLREAIELIQAPTTLSGKVLSQGMKYCIINNKVIELPNKIHYVSIK